MSSEALLSKIRNGESLSQKEMIITVLLLSGPSIMAQLTTVIMQYLDAAMVGRLGSSQAASIALVSSSTWLIGGQIAAWLLGFNILIAHEIGAKRDERARSLMKHELLWLAFLTLTLTLICVTLSPYLPRWLGGHADIIKDASMYFRIYGLSLLFVGLTRGCAGMIQSTGDILIVAVLNVIMCLLDVIFNAFFIFPSHTFFFLPGMNLGVTGAALGTAMSYVVGGLTLLIYLCFISDKLKLRADEHFHFNLEDTTEALRLSLPVSFNEFVYGSAQMMLTRIISPLGPLSLATHSFAVTAESICYMPGYGIQLASTTLIGQSMGAKRKELAKQFSRLILTLGMSLMTLTGLFLFIASPFMMSLFTTNKEIIHLGVRVLRIEAFAEPFFASLLVSTGICRGGGDTLTPSLSELISMWGIRIPLALLLTPHFGLTGAWIAMCIQLISVGLFMIIYLHTNRWMKLEV
ncbi:MAG: MATE family efflux transporter [Erysipelotrichaceae bacterium]|nr:MATE family efflux transporter [Erysipelotrichaceae bacterium]